MNRTDGQIFCPQCGADLPVPEGYCRACTPVDWHSPPVRMAIDVIEKRRARCDRLARERREDMAAEDAAEFEIACEEQERGEA